jgi:lipid-A-disaccharide synthase
MLIAGEASGDTLGAELVKALIRSSPHNLFFSGAGGPKMSSEGVQLEFDLTTHAVMGIWEVLKNYGKFKRFFDRLLAVAATRKPDLIILIDYPGFNLRFAAAVKKLAAKTPEWKPKVVFYVSPQLWAWHESRIHQIGRDIDLMLAIFPFEKAWYAERKPDFKVEFVGHPLIERYAGTAVPIPNNNLLLVLLPGSRVRELRKHLPVMVESVQRLRTTMPTLEIRMILPTEKLKTLAQSFTQHCCGIDLHVGGLSESLSVATAALASSGTVTMECAWFRVPTVVIYKTSWSTFFLAKRFVRVSFVAMPNLLAGKQVYPELLQEQANAENITRALHELLQNAEGRKRIRHDLADVIRSLGEPGAAQRAAHHILKLL